MKQDIYHIRQLLSLYYAGLTSGEQERELAEYFAAASEETLADDLRADRVAFLAAQRGFGTAPVPEALGGQLAAHIDRLAAQERRARRGRRLMVWTSVAASLAIVLTATMFVIKEASIAAYEPDDPDEAQVEAQRALLLVSDCLNKADRKAEEADLLLERLGLDMSIFDGEEPADTVGDAPAATGEHSDSVGV